MKFFVISAIWLTTLTLAHAIPAPNPFPQTTSEVDCYGDYCKSFERSTSKCDLPWMKGEFTKDQFIECLCTKEIEDEYQKYVLGNPWSYVSCFKELMWYVCEWRCYTCEKEHNKKEYQTLYTYQCSEEFKFKDDTTDDKKENTTKGNDAGALYFNKGMAGLTIVVGGLIATM